MQAPEVIVGRYRVQRPVGHGGMGTVWLCEDERLGRDVAVKQVGLLPGESAPDLARALREARSSAGLNHPHVVAVYDAVEDEDDRLWLVMEYVPGHTLSDLVKAEQRLEPRRVAAIGAQVAGGLAAAHARGTVHRDVKPGNIFVDGATAKIGDFGIARTEGDAQLTRSGLLIGTPLYFSPELARGADPAPASDVWALGATLYAAVEGRLPVEDRGNPIATLAAIADAQVPEPEHAGPLAPVLARMLEVDPAARCSMREAADQLGRLADEHPTQTLETPVGPTAPLAAAPLAAAATPAPEPGATAPEAAEEPGPVPVAPVAPVASTRDRRGRAPWLVPLLIVLLLAAGGLALLLVPGEDGEPAADPGRPSGSAAPDRSASPDDGQSGAAEEPAEQDDDEGDEGDEEEGEPDDGSGAADGAGSREELVADYYALLPDDTESAWELLGEEARSDAGGYGGFTGFWSTIDSVTVQGTSVDDDGVVTVELLYDGSESESRELLVEESGGSLLIADDRGRV